MLTISKKDVTEIWVRTIVLPHFVKAVIRFFLKRGTAMMIV